LQKLEVLAIFINILQLSSLKTTNFIQLCLKLQSRIKQKEYYIYPLRWFLNRPIVFQVAKVILKKSPLQFLHMDFLNLLARNTAKHFMTNLALTIQFAGHLTLME